MSLSARGAILFEEETALSWQQEVDQIERRVELARAMGGEANIERQHKAGRLTVRERIERLLDAETFHEIGALAGKATYDEAGEIEEFVPSNFVLGTGKIDGRRVVVGGDDFTVRGGAADARVGNKMGFGEKLALGMRLPMVRLVDGTGGGGSVKTLEMTGFSYVPVLPTWEAAVELMGVVPVVGACLGPVAGLGAVRVAASHFSLMVKGSSQLFVAGPPVVERGIGEDVDKEELGGSEIHAHGSGAVDVEVESEDEALRTIARYLSYLPGNVWELPPRVEPNDDVARREEALLSVIPRDRRQTYDVRSVLEMILDRDSLFEIGEFYGRPIVTALARLDGYPVGVLANDPRQGGGAPDMPGCEKMMRFVEMCDTFHLPVVNFVDNPGFLIGTAAERAGTVRFGTRALATVFQAQIPWVSILMRRVYGVAGAAHGNADRLNLRYAWPSGDWGSLPIEGGVQAAYRREIEAAEDPAARRAEIEARLNAVRSPFRTAEAFGIEEIIDPRDTRGILCEWVEMAYGLLPSQLGIKARTARP